MASKIGFWAFIIGFIICIIGGFITSWSSNSTILIILLVLGLLIGFLNVTAKETTLFLVAAIALIVIGHVFTSFTLLGIGAFLDRALSLVATLMAPAAVVVAIKALWAAGKPGD